MLNIDLPSEIEDALRLQAAQSGQDVGEFVAQAVRGEDRSIGDFSCGLHPFAKAVEASGASDEEFDRFSSRSAATKCGD